MKFLKVTSNKGFTLIELLVVIAIISILSSTVLVSLQSAERKAKISKAKAELNQLRSAIAMLEAGTGLQPNKISSTPCVQNSGVHLNKRAAGLESTDGGFPDWNGPYMDSVPKDPWGTYYYFDADYTCGDAEGCESVPEGKTVRVIQSFGPNKAQNYGSGSDDIVLILCR